MDFGNFSLESISLPTALIEAGPARAVRINAVFKQVFGPCLDADGSLQFDDLDTLLGGQLRDLHPESGGSIIQEIKIGRKRHSFEFKIGLDASSETSPLLLLGLDRSDLVKAEAKLSSYVRIIEKNNRELQFLANTDPLTGAANRRALFNRFQELAERQPDFHCAVSILDIDHFKRYNDEYGHDFGDFVLKTFADQIRTQLTEKTIFARIGGEEFCVVDYSGSADIASEKLEDALEAVRDLQLDTPKTEHVNITFSAGVAEFGKDGEMLDDLLKNADLALYYAKANGRSCVIPYSAELFQKRDRTLVARVNNRESRE